MAEYDCICEHCAFAGACPSAYFPLNKQICADIRDKRNKPKNDFKEEFYMEKLLPCPFCGRQAELRYTEEGFAYIVCANDGCYVRTDGHLNEKAAIKAWNRRTEKPQ